MQQLMADRTSFMIAHRLTTLDICDVRLELTDGRIVSRQPGEADTVRAAGDTVHV
jgi:ABC-type multidrug transport system fused ATPase/permease subunit